MLRGWHFCAIGGEELRTLLYSIGTSLGKTVEGSVALITLAMEGWVLAVSKKRSPVAKRLQQLWNDERGQDIAEYAVMLAVILVIVVGTIRLIGSNANNVFSSVGSSIQ